MFEKLLYNFSKVFHPSVQNITLLGLAGYILYPYILSLYFFLDMSVDIGCLSCRCKLLLLLPGPVLLLDLALALQRCKCLCPIIRINVLRNSISTVFNCTIYCTQTVRPHTSSALQVYPVRIMNGDANYLN